MYTRRFDFRFRCDTLGIFSEITLPFVSNPSRREVAAMSLTKVRHVTSRCCRLSNWPSGCCFIRGRFETSERKGKYYRRLLVNHTSMLSYEKKWNRLMLVQTSSSHSYSSELKHSLNLFTTAVILGSMFPFYLGLCRFSRMIL